MGSASSRPGVAGKDDVSFAVMAETSPGSGVRVVGSCTDLGNWNPDGALKLTTSPGAYPRWSVTVNIPPEVPALETVEYKFVIVKPDGEVTWEERGNRILKVGSANVPETSTPWFGAEDKDGATNPKDAALAKAGEKPKAKEAEEVPKTPEEPKEATPKPASQFDAKQDLPASPGEKSESKRWTAASLEQAPSSGMSPSNGFSRMQSAPDGGAAGKFKPASRKPGKANEAPGGISEGVSGLSHKRCPSLPNLAMIAEPSSGFGGFARQATPDAGAQFITLKIDGMTDAKAEDMTVEVVFEATGFSFDLKYVPWNQAWVLDYAETDMPGGLHLFHFLVDEEKMLSRNHPIYDGSNATLFSDKIRGYVLGRETKAVKAFGGDSASKGMGSPAKKMGMRAHSIGHNLSSLADMAGDDSEDDDDDGIGESNAAALKGGVSGSFPDNIFEKLFDPELRLRLHSYALPDVKVAPGEVNMVMKTGSYQLSKKYGTGRSEDAHFATATAMGVADGVGCMVQFASYGVNAADYSADLMECANKSLMPGGSACKENFVGEVDERAQAACDAGEHGARAYGASTMVTLCLEGNQIGVANLGDSGFMLLRKGPNGMVIVLKSDEQQHSWNCPYQLTRLPPALARKFPKLDQDNASDCNLYKAQVRSGDLILMFTDGLRDNVHDHEILSIVDRTLSPAFADLIDFPNLATDPNAIAKTLVLAAQLRSLDPHAKVPFTLYSRRHGYDCPGGKDDDITVVAAWVVPEGGSTIPALVMDRDEE
mmetsp:Transcript_34289/g.101872  ORF Transcript_34289/g.101872 Transcript_34289/m.101872 type:complete len:767 (-) Transcript_34289:398-2698(-)